MKFLTVPARNDLPWTRFRISLAGVIYTMHLRFNMRMNRWMMDINDASDNPILNGVPVLILVNLTGQYTTLALPDGTLFATDDTNTDTQATLLSFGLDHTLWFGDASQ